MTPGFGPRPDFGEEKRTIVGASIEFDACRTEPTFRPIWHVKRNMRERLRYYWLRLKRWRREYKLA